MSHALYKAAIFGLCIAVSTVTFQVATATIADGAAKDDKRKINLAGRQRMLSQRMAKAVCLEKLGVETKLNAEQIQLAHYLFDQTLSDLRQGSSVQELLPERDPAVLAALATVGADWKVYGPAVLARDFDAVIRLSPIILEHANAAVGRIRSAARASGELAPEFAAAVDIAGRQRMLTQKATKEFCLVAAGRDAARNRADLVATVALFETSMRGLRDGDSALGLGPAPAGAIVDEIDSAREAWTPLVAIFTRIAAGATPSSEDIASVVRLEDQALQKMQTIVELYEALAD